MPATLTADLMRRSPEAKLSLGIEPAPNILTSMQFINSVEALSGLGEWVTRTAAQLSPAQLHRNRLVFDGIYYAVQPVQRWPSFTTYLDNLGSIDPAILRDRLLAQIACPLTPSNPERRVLISHADLLASADAYLNFVRAHFETIDEAIEREAHALLCDPPALQRVATSHIRELWDSSMAAEWERVLPMLQESVAAFERLDLAGKSSSEVVRLVTGQEPDEKWERLVAEAQQIVFVPSAHIGPYLRKCLARPIMWLVFGARLPEGAPVSGSALSRSDLLVRLGALTDDTRLRVLALLAQHDELCAQDIMTMLDLTQSATSRHLRQLSATGYITERRREIAKCYTLNRARLGDTFRAVEQFLAQPEP